MKRMLADVCPELINEWSQRNLPLTPDSVTHGSNKIVWWNGKCGHEWRASIKNRVISGSGCPYCSHNAILEGYNDLASQKPELAAEWSDKNDPLLPTQVTVFANRKAWWKCRECGNELAIMVYAGMNKMSVKFDDDSIIGIPLESYLSEEKLAIETSKPNENEYRLKQYLCKKRNINTKFPVVFEYEGENTKTVDLTVNDGEPITNELIYGTVSGKKIDENGEALGGAVIGLFKSADAEFTAENATLTTESAEDGSFTFGEDTIPYGTWYVREIEQPTGFVLNDTVYPVTIGKDGEVVEIEIVNEHIRGNVKTTNWIFRGCLMRAVCSVMEQAAFLRLYKDF